MMASCGTLRAITRNCRPLDWRLSLAGAPIESWRPVEKLQQASRNFLLGTGPVKQEVALYRVVAWGRRSNGAKSSSAANDCRPVFGQILMIEARWAWSEVAHSKRPNLAQSPASTWRYFRRPIDQIGGAPKSGQPVE